MTASVAPVALFVYRRPEHVRRVLEALRANPEASQTDLHVYSDGAKHPNVEDAVAEVRKTIRSVAGFRSVNVVERSQNLGLARSITQGVGELTRRFDSVIVLEDDLLPSPHFLAYMNAGLERYANESRVVSVHAYCFPVRESLPDTFFIRGADCWGWGTWRRGWEVFDADGARLLSQILERRLKHEFDLDGGYPFTRMLADSVAGRNDSWAIRWYASAFLRGLLTLYPGVSQIQNIGADGSGTHDGVSDIYTHARWGRPLQVAAIPIEESALARTAFSRFLRSTQPTLLDRVHTRVRRLVRSVGIGR